jgi:periplasmic protein TonB
LIDSWLADMQTNAPLAASAASSEDFEIMVEFSDGPFDDFLPAPWPGKASFFSDPKTWSSLALVLFLHSALACLLWLSPKPQPQSHKWIEVQLVSISGEAGSAGPGPGEPGPPVQEVKESPKLTQPLGNPLPEKKIDRTPPVPVKKTVRPAPTPPREEITTARQQPVDAESHGNPDPAPQGSGTSAGASSGNIASSSSVSTGAGRGGGGSGPVERTFGSPNGPSFLHRVMPTYPPLARRLQQQGTVLLRVTVDEHGRPAEVELLQKAGFGLDEEAVKAVKESTFVPAKMDGKPLTCKALLPIRFVLTQ